MRLDRFLASCCPDLTRSRLTKLIQDGMVTLNGRPAKPSQPVHARDRVALTIPPPVPLNMEPENIPISILYEDNDLMVVDKPWGLTVHPAPGHPSHTLVNALLALRPNLSGIGGVQRPGIVHRLDKDTSGVMLLARNRVAAARMGTTFRQRETRKIYWAAVVGVPELSQGRIDAPLGKMPGRAGERVGVDDVNGKSAVTLYHVMDKSASRLAWVAFWPLTGRTHQLRAHAMVLETPILGDGKYGGADAFLTGIEIPRQLHLHARRLVTPHPSGRGVLQLDAELPSHMKKTWADFGWFEPTTEEEIDPFPEEA